MAHMNPLKQMIDKMKTQLAMKGTKRSCYDLGVYDLNTVKDGKRPPASLIFYCIPEMFGDPGIFLLAITPGGTVTLDYR